MLRLLILLSFLEVQRQCKKDQPWGQWWLHKLSPSAIDFHIVLGPGYRDQSHLRWPEECSWLVRTRLVSLHKQCLLLLHKVHRAPDNPGRTFDICPNSEINKSTIESIYSKQNKIFNFLHEDFHRIEHGSLGQSMHKVLEETKMQFLMDSCYAYEDMGWIPLVAFIGEIQIDNKHIFVWKPYNALMTS